MFNRNFLRQMPVVNIPNQEGFIDIDNNTGNIDIDFNQSQTQNVNSSVMPVAGSSCPQTSMSPIIEPVRERVINRRIEHVVPHVCPIRTRIVNHHVYKHTYQPNYTCCEENIVSNEQCGSCCNFR